VNCPSCGVENVADAAACTRCGTGLPVTPTQVVITVDLRPGSVFDSRYEILGTLGQGGMGMVYKARDRSLDETVAIKILRPDFAQDPRMAERFKSEIRLARRVRHPNVCAIHDYGEDRGLLYISMEYVEGVDLKKLLREEGAFGAEAGYAVAIQIAEGLQAVHDAGIIHRDLKAPNIMRDAAGQTRLMDFGIAKRQGDGTRTATGHIVGTPEYMSPEQAQGHRVDFRSDIYALGIVIYEIFTGRVPFRGETPISTILKHLHDPPPLEPPEGAALPPAVRALLKRCLAKDPAERFASAREVAEALRGARSPSRRQQPVPTSALQAPTLEAPTRQAPAVTRVESAPRRSSLQPWLLAVPLVVVSAGVVILRTSQSAAPSLPLAPTAAPLTTVRAAVPTTLGAASATTSAVLPLPSPAAVPSANAARPPADRPPVTRPPVSTPSSFDRRSGGGAGGSSPRVAPATPVAAAARPEPPPAAAANPTLTPAATAPPATAAAPGLLQVAVRPWGEVSVDGRVIGTTPLDRIPLAPGSHVLRVRHPSYELWEKPVTIRSGDTTKIVVDLPTEGVKKQD
jgi:serine/threonine protein kinase